MTVSFVRLEPDPQSLIVSSRKITEAVADVIDAHPHCSPSALAFPPLVSGGADSRLFKLNFANPVYDFTIELHDDKIQFAKFSATLEDLYLTAQLFERISEMLFDEHSVYSLRGQPYLRRVYRVSHDYRYYVTLGTKLTDPETMVTNSELMPAFVAPESDERSILGVLQPEDVVRADATLSMLKTIAQRKRNLWVRVEAPWNVTRRDLQLSVEMRTGSAELADDVLDSDLKDFHTPMGPFLRDMVLTRLFPTFFHDMTVVARP